MMADAAMVNNHDVLTIRKDFPIFAKTNRGNPLVYLDSAASAQKPKQVIAAMNYFYEHDYANIHRGIYELSERATHLYEQVRTTVKNFINANEADEIVFVRGTTEAINLVAQAYGRSKWQKGDEVILSTMEHHSNIVPWYQLREEMGIVLKIIPIHDDGSLDMSAYQQLFSHRTKLVAISHVSNALGTINPITEITKIAHIHQVPVLVDGAQAVPHMKVDVKEIDCDFYAFSGHKLYGPTGIGVLYAKKHLLNAMPPYQGGGDMIDSVAFDKITYAKVPQKFEAGTPNIAGTLGLASAIEYVTQIGMNAIYDHEQALLHYAQEKMLAIEGLRIIGTANPKVGVISFVIDGIHPHDIGTVLDHEGIAIRAGHHCAMPLMERLQVPATVRASFGVYTNENDIDELVKAIHLAKRLFS